MRFDADQLRALAAVADEGGFDAAARALSITPSAVSQRIKTLERELGRVLVVRSRPPRLTVSGEPVARLARQWALLEHEATDVLGLESPGAMPRLPIAVNADSLSVLLLPALAGVCAEHGVTVDLHRDDQDHTAALLAAGTVMAAVTSEQQPVAGCSVASLGAMVYRPVARRSFAERWFPAGGTAAEYAAAPLVDFDRKDGLQDLHLASIGPALDPPRHYVPASAELAQAVVLGLGWGMLPDAQADEHRASGVLVDLAGAPVSVPLFWQQWDLRSRLLDAVAAAVYREAATSLER